MILIRCFFCIFIIWIGGFFSGVFIKTAFVSNDVIKISGILSIWSAIASLLLGIMLLYYHVKAFWGNTLKGNTLNRLLIFLGLVVAPIISIVIYVKTLTLVADYIECKELNNISIRFSSQTYTISNELCLQLIDDRNK
ncbi:MULTISPECIES: hypothetical protein [Aliivibrio]|uniref:Uncharacterized protein n=1 Tax=Aliivibrio finisterrensis TaxID=511998 RepID=A0A4Q5KM75_9GAMM|nr:MULTISPECIES: hypothetical protein [Aliivibrio]MDD9180744.1 hypothetical protein [Aliivibrio sp. A6]RYU46507.1 hypothetical protein ERW57_19225 [Aliivibrio finisterrensis]RYU47069.1 hypothetical protein ERW56_19460 [Aliivibrio finisterrensis]RYU51502.1 hypothetical protein ERW50_19525 [Aliivibrio finisterrensis]RYU58843.1 hypothetical protein ERW53_20280 [Aliivibrio finisterrensis]